MQAYRPFIALISAVAFFASDILAMRLLAQVPEPPRPAGIFPTEGVGPQLQLPDPNAATPDRADSAQPAPDARSVEGAEEPQYDTRGPIHEAFAVPVTPDAEETIV